MLLASVVGVCDQMLAKLKQDLKHPALPAPMGVREMFRRFGADDWDPRRTRYRDPPAKQKVV
jgi:hypothetical protein